MDAATLDPKTGHHPTLDNTRYSPIGLRFSFLLDAKDTNGRCSLQLVTAKRGAGPARHVHSREDEVFYVLAGEMRGYVGDDVVALNAGDTAFLPRNVPHTYQVISEEATFLAMITPAGFEGFFHEITDPVASLDMPPGPAQPPADPARIARLMTEYGVLVVGPPVPVS